MFPLIIGGIFSLFLQMKPVEESMKQRRKHDAGDDQEYDSGVKRIERGEYFAGIGLE